MPVHCVGTLLVPPRRKVILVPALLTARARVFIRRAVRFRQSGSSSESSHTDFRSGGTAYSVIRIHKHMSWEDLRVYSLWWSKQPPERYQLE